MPNESSGRTRTAIEAAQALFDMDGLGAVTMEAVSSRTGIAKTTLYRRWANAEELALDTCLHAMKRSAPVPQQGAFPERLRQLLRSAARFMRSKDGERLRQIIGLSQTKLSLKKAIQERFLAERRAEARSLLQEARLAGVVAYSDVEVVLDLIAGPLYHRLLMGHLPLTDTFADAQAELLSKALGFAAPAAS